MKVLLVYSSHDGQTYKIMTVVADKLKSQSIEPDMVDLSQSDYVNTTDYDAVCLGASIRYGRFNSRVKSFINENTVKLTHKISAFFSVSLVARKAEKRTPETNSYTRKLLQSIYWRPNLVEIFAGALHYPMYNWLDRMMIKLIMKMTGGETDTTQDVEYTDWQQVDEFANKFVELIKNADSAALESSTAQKLYV